MGELSTFNMHEHNKKVYYYVLVLNQLILDYNDKMIIFFKIIQYLKMQLISIFPHYNYKIGYISNLFKIFEDYFIGSYLHIFVLIIIKAHLYSTLKI